MKKFIYALTLCIAAGMTSCKDDDSVYSPSDLDRMPRTMFRSENTTNVRPENDEYSSKLIPGTRNSVQLHWYGISGAAGYEIRYAENLTTGLMEDWSDPTKIVESCFFGPAHTTCVFHKKKKGTGYSLIKPVG